MKITITNCNSYLCENYRGMDIEEFKKELTKFNQFGDSDAGFPFCGKRLGIEESDKEEIVSTINELKRLLNGEIVNGWEYISTLSGAPFTMFTVGKPATSKWDNTSIEYSLNNCKELIKRNFYASKIENDFWRVKYSNIANGKLLLAEKILSEYGKVWGEF